MILQPQIPTTLAYRGGTINLAGRGQTPGSHLYMDLRHGAPVEVYLGQVVQTGPYFCQVEVKNNAVLRRVRVDHGLLRDEAGSIGEVLLVGPIEYRAEGPRARASWRVRMVAITSSPTNGYKGAGLRRKGVIVSVALSGTHGSILPDGSQERVFVHVSNLRRNTQLRVGQRVSFDLAHNDRGPTAFNVWPA